MYKISTMNYEISYPFIKKMEEELNNNIEQ
jgi:hypothetical protein